MTRSSDRSSWVGRALVSAIGAVLVSASLFSPATVRAVSGPVARWTLDDGSGLNAHDAVGTADGTLSGGATWLTSNAAVGTGALSFDGVNDKVTVPGSAPLEPAELTLTLWVRGDPQSPPATGAVIIEKGAFDCLGPSYGLYVAADGVRLSFRSPNGVQLQFTATEAEAGVTLWDGAWHLLSARMRIFGFYHNSVAGTIMIDGYPEEYEAVGDILDITTPQTAAIGYSGATNGALVFGGPVNGGCGEASFHGDIDDVRVYADPTLLSATLMPTVTTIVSGMWTPPQNPGGSAVSHVDVTPIPRWGTVTWEIFVSGTWTTWGSTHPDETGHAVGGGVVPLAVGTYPVRATFSAGPPYLDSSQEGTVTVEPYTTTTLLSVAPDPFLAGEQVRLNAFVDSLPVDSSPYPQGSVKFWETTSGTPVLLDTVAVAQYGVSGDGAADLYISTFPVGTHKVVAEYIGPDPYRAGSTSTEKTVVVNANASGVVLQNLTNGPIETHSSFTIGAILQNGNNTYAENATFTFKRVGSSTPICVVPVAFGTHTQCVVPSQAIGSPQFIAEYSGNAQNAAATSSPLTVNVVADTVHASGVSVQYTTFYPYKDSYKDTVAIKGTRGEPISVTIRIYSPSGTLRKTVTIPSGTGAYSYAWNGRNSAGTWYAEGKYKVVQTLKDGAGTTTTSTLYTTLSRKKLYTYTKTITKLGRSMTAFGATGGGTVKISTASGYAKLSAPTFGTSWAGAGWEFTLPSAAVYKSVYVRVYGRHSGITGFTALGAENFTFCPYVAHEVWEEACFGAWKNIPTTSGTTLHYYQSVSLSSAYRSGTHVRASVSSYGGTTYIYKAQVIVKYGLLKY